MNSKDINFWKVLFNNEFPQTAGDRFFIKDQLYRNFAPRIKDWTSFDPRVLDSLDNWRYRLKGDAYDMFGDIFRGSLLERDKYIRDAKYIDPNRNLMKYAGGTEDLAKPKVIKNWMNTMNYNARPAIGYAVEDLFRGYPSLGSIVSDIYNSPVVKYGGKALERVAVPLAIYEGLSQPTVSGEAEQDAYNNWAAQHGQPLQAGISY